MAVPTPLFDKAVTGIYSTRDMATQLPIAERAKYLSWCDQLQAAMIVSEAEPAGVPTSDGTTKKKRPCVQCGKPASLRCSSCKDLPVTYTSDPGLAYYCSKDCSKIHWKEHKPICKRLVARKSLYRAGEVLQDVFYVRHEEGFPFKLVNVTQKGEELHWYHPTIAPGEAVYHKVDTSLFDHDIPRYRKVLATNTCGKTVTCWSQLLNKVLNGFVDHNMIFEINIKYKGPGNQTWEHNIDSGAFETDPTGAHEYWKVHLSDTEVYALDLTGAQFGWTEPVVPWLEYEKRHVKEYCESFKYGTASQMLMDHKKLEMAGDDYDGIYLMRMTIEQGAMRRIEEICHQPFPPMRVSFNFDTLFKLPEDPYQLLRTEFLGMLRTRLRASLDAMNQSRKKTGTIPINLLAWPRFHIDWVPGKSLG